MGYALKNEGFQPPWPFIGTFVILCGIVISVRKLTYGRIHIKQLSVPSASITLDKESGSFFDQYLDEIVHFFSVTKKRIIIFEDIDRFDDPHIFETLRALNEVLNKSPNIGEPVRFIYAIKDSIFDKLGEDISADQSNNVNAHVIDVIIDTARTELVRSNRTKFFDLVIPVVPFITHQSARDLLEHHVLSGVEHCVDQKLFDVAAQYVPDMRLLKNVRNEFCIFRDQLRVGVEDNDLNLDETKLFAMMLYKSTHLTDFERIRSGESKLDELYGAFRQFVSEGIKEREASIKFFEQQASEETQKKAQAQYLGEKILDYTSIMANAIHPTSSDRGNFTFENERIEEDELKTPRFWSEFSKAQSSAKVIWRLNGYSPHNLNSKVIAEITGDDLEVSKWSKKNMEEINRQISRLRNEVDLFKKATMATLLENSQLSIDRDDQKRSFQYILDSISPSELVTVLIRMGFLDEHFILYASTFHGVRVSGKSMRFLIQHVNRNLPDPHFILSGSDSAQVMREIGDSALNEQVLYNVSLLDYLLTGEDFQAECTKIVHSLSKMGREQIDFLRIYAENGKCPELLTEKLASHSLKILVVIVDCLNLEQDITNRLMSAAFRGLSDDIFYEVSDELSQHLDQNYSKIPILSDAGLTEAQVPSIAVVFEDCEVQIEDLDAIDDLLKAEFIDRDLYQINRKNLTLITADKEDIALDSIKKRSRQVYSYCVKHFEDYVNCLEDQLLSLQNGEHLSGIINELEDFHESSSFVTFVEKVTPVASVNNLSEVAISSWVILATQGKIYPNWTNIKAYVDEIGLDLAIGRQFESPELIKEIDNFTQEGRMDLAYSILDSREVFPDSKIRALAVHTLELENYLDLDLIEAESSELFAELLLQADLEDSIEVYEKLLGEEWSSREALIVHSEAFKKYVSPSLIRDDLSQILNSPKVPSEIKKQIVTQSLEYFDDATADQLGSLAAFALENESKLPVSMILTLAELEIAPENIVKLMSSILERMSVDHINETLEKLPGDYSDLTVPGRKHLHFPNDEPHSRLLELLRNSKSSPVSTPIHGKHQIVVHRKHSLP
ncbi:YobI family P-loop NTPase [Corynebacterium glutamicum]|uniref:YobI-like P-loop NTPase domain-containing protein n=2 Tax=Corynebacterium glutamicum TaxID=1718 RepID=A0AB36I559_CORGT|nr:hypothetical protein [Corynebacterium glutamicum]AGN20025.1 hypothetical protein C624_12290 [Corynebacterium glutamicum SCgG1]AGN23049.1 hypothetical protein C629_12295 [Corynebacterium glutamicum SCgG2]OKX76102.1 hypothetical protein AUP70_15080 [Corynebacterium glutamicum]OKX84913.1 hypothetical protein AUP69_00100 [Corynebacterium glutamicum]TWS42368.1 hypothetical protein AKJ22_15525 [Corynebacterium glutamicum]